MSKEIKLFYRLLQYFKLMLKWLFRKQLLILTKMLKFTIQNLITEILRNIGLGGGISGLSGWCQRSLDVLETQIVKLEVGRTLRVWENILIVNLTNNK
jgi:hypothetical protein